MKSLFGQFLLACSKINHWLYAVVCSEHSTFSVAWSASWTNTICHVSEGRQTEYAGAPGAMSGYLKSQMRSHLDNNKGPSRSTRTATFLHMQWDQGIVDLGESVREDSPKRKNRRERKQLLPAAMHQHITPVTSYTPHFIWNVTAWLELNGTADTFFCMYLQADSSHALPPYQLQKIHKLPRKNFWEKTYKQPENNT